MRRRNEVTVGILLTVAVIVLITGTLWLVRGGLSRGYPLHARFPWGQNLKQGQEVLLAGVTIGYVSKVRLNDDGFLDVDMQITHGYKVPRTVVAEVYPVGIFGDVAVALKPSGPSKMAFAEGDTIPSRPATGGIDALQARADTITNSLNRITSAFETELVRQGGLHELRQTAVAMNQLVAQLQQIAAVQSRNLSSVATSFNRAAGAFDSAQVASMLRAMKQTSANVDTLTLRLSSNSTQLQALLARLERGEGTAGKLLADTTL